MKPFLLIAAGLSWATASYAQTTPASPPATTAPNSASGTKNVGTDRADAPQAPGMTPPAGAGSSSSSMPARPTTSPQRPKRAATRKQATLQTGPQ